jgi:polyhydroxyalkanoate synthesis regulator protein
LHKAFEDSMGNNPLAKIAQQNLAMFKAAAAAFMPGGAGEADKAEPAATGEPVKDELAGLRAQMAEMQQKLDQLGK